MLDTILDWFGLGSVSGVDVLFAACAIIGTILFILYFILVPVSYTHLTLPTIYSV